MLAFRVQGRRVLVVGGGKVGTERTQAALAGKARVTVLAPKEGLGLTLSSLVATKEVEWIDRHYTGSEEDFLLLQNAELVLSTIDDTPLSEGIAMACRRMRIPVNCADIPHLCDFWFMSVHREGPLQVGVSTNGNGPRLSSLLRKHIASSLPTGAGEAVARLGKLRKRIRLTDPDPTSVRQRMKWLSDFCDSTPIELLAEMSEEEMEALLEKYVNKEQPRLPSNNKKANKIVLLGAGPGNPELLTIAGKKALEKAEVVIADALIPDAIVDIARRNGAEIVVAKKHEEGADQEQQRLNESGVTALRRGKRVVRVKGGDPFLFARGGEEILWYKEHGFDVEVIPGVSSCFSAPAAANIPITHRGVAEQILILTAHGRGGAAPTIPPFMATRTLVFLMTAARAGFVATRLMESGYPNNLPASIVENATRPNQRTFYATLETLGEVAKKNKVTHPATIIVGQVVAVLHQDLYNKLEDEREKEKAEETEDIARQQILLPSILPPTSSNVQNLLPPPQQALPPHHLPGVSPAHAVAAASVSVVCPPATKAIDFSDQHLAFINQKLSGRTPQQILMWCADTLPGLVQVTSFGATGMVILDMMSKLGISMPSIFLDTLHHFEETIHHANWMEKKYDLKLHRYSCQNASTKEEFEKLYGEELWIADDKRYDYLVKVEPLERALRELNVKAWITGRRRDQGGMRANVEVLEFDVDGRLKVNILANWSWEDVWQYVNENKVPYNTLYDQNYKSIGDYHSTRPVASGEDERSGRFFHQKEKTECGIHNRWKYTKSDADSQSL